MTIPSADAMPANLETPCVVIDRPRLLRNIRRVQDIADRHGVALRPHIKTHKSIAIARLQGEAGAIGVTAAKPDEAIVFMAAGIGSVTIAYPILDGRKLDRVLEQARSSGCEVRFIADSTALADALSAAAVRHDRRLPVFLKVDVGLHRIGVAPDGPEAQTVARRIAGDPALVFQGLIAHAGHAYGASGPEAIAAVAEAERATLLRVAGRLRAIGIACPEMSVGSTPTTLAGHSFEGLSEIRPGNYVFLDHTAIRLGIAGFGDIALTVLATVISVNDRYAIIDAGSKVLSSDLGPHGTGGVAGYGRAFTGALGDGEGLTVERLSEEHGFVRLDGQRLQTGMRVRIVPNHACVVANLATQFQVIDGNEPLRTWPVDARACVR